MAAHRTKPPLSPGRQARGSSRQPRGRGIQLAAGASAGAGEWLLFLHADCRLSPDWEAAVAAFLAAPEATSRAGYFDFALDDAAPAARRLERIVAWRCRVLRSALWRSRSADRPQPVLRGRRICAAAVDGRRRPRSPPRPPATRPHRRAMHLVAAALPPGRILASAIAQSLLPVALLRRGVARRIMRLYG